MPIGTLSQKIQCQFDALGDGATDDRADCDRETADAAPGAQRERSALRRTRRPTGWSASVA